MSYKVFISATTYDLKEHREEVARVLRRKGLEVVEQAHFEQGDHTLLKKLDDKIGACQAAILVVGDTFGDAPFDEQVNAHDHGVDFEGICKEIDIPYLSYTQWEYVLAKKKYKIPTYVFLHQTDIVPAEHIKNRTEEVAPFQKAYIEWVKRFGEDRNIIDYNAADKGLKQLIEDVLVLNLPTFRSDIPFSIPFNSLQDMFIGRNEDLAALRKSLTNPDKKQVATSIYPNALYGLGGIGKTRLAAEYAHRYKSEYTALFFINSDDVSGIESNLADLCRATALNLDQRDAIEQEIKFNAVINWLNTNPGWLLLFDNADKDESVTYVKELTTKLHGGHILITS